MDDIASTASSELVSSKSSSPSVPKQSFPPTSGVVGGNLAFYAEGLQTEMGRTSRGGSAVLVEGFFEPITLNTSAMGGGA